jgi:hypothetical protein
MEAIHNQERIANMSTQVTEQAVLPKDVGRSGAFSRGRDEAVAWAADRRNFRVKTRMGGYEEWLTSANGDHRPEVHEEALGYLQGLRDHLNSW